MCHGPRISRAGHLLQPRMLACPKSVGHSPLNPTRGRQGKTPSEGEAGGCSSQQLGTSACLDPPRLKKVKSLLARGQGRNFISVVLTRLIHVRSASKGRDVSKRSDDMYHSAIKTLRLAYKTCPDQGRRWDSTLGLGIHESIRD